MFSLLLDFEARAESQPDKIQIIGFGDSLMAGYEIGKDEAFPAQLETALNTIGIPAIVENAGVSGDTTSSGLARLDWVLGDRQVDMVIVELGANDALRGLSPDVTRDNLQNIIEKLKSRDITILLAGMLAPLNMGEQYGAEFEKIFTDIVQDEDLAFYPFFLDGVAAQPELNLADGIHPTPKGVQIIVERILPVVIKTLLDEGHCGTREKPKCADKVFEMEQNL